MRIVSALVVMISAFVLSAALVFAAPGDVEVDVVVRGESSVGVPDATVTVYVLNESTDVYEQYEGTYTTNASGRANNVNVPPESTFYAFGVDGEGNEYAGSGFDFDNIWSAHSDGSIENLETGSTRGPAATFVHLYPGDNSVTADEGTVSSSEASASASGSIDTGDTSHSEDVSDESGSGSTDLAPIEGAEDFEVEVTVYDVHRNPINGANVTLHVHGHGAYSTDSTDGAGRTDEIMAPLGYNFYASAVDSSGQVYGGTYDYYYDRLNTWRGDSDGDTIMNITTGTTRLPYLHLYPAEMDPEWVESGSEDDRDAYKCGGFPDAMYADVTPEECTAIEYVVDEEIFSGTGEGLLEWNRPINRAEVTKVMLEAFGHPTGTPATYARIFPDVPQLGVWFSNYVYNALNLEIVGGYPDGFFRPAQTINRVELLRIFIEASGTDYSDVPTHFTFWHDVEVNTGTQWFIPYANFAFFNELLENDGNLRPAQAMTRMDVIKLLYRASLITE